MSLHLSPPDNGPNSHEPRATKLRWLAVALFASLSFYAGDSTAQSPAASRSAARPTGTIAGRVTARGKGLPDVIVTLLSVSVGGGQPQNLPQTKTDADGNYRLADVPMGSYIVTPVAPVYVVPNAVRFTSASEPVVITGGETVEGVDFSLVRGGVITGKVTDAGGRPVIEQPVSILNADQQQPLGRGPGSGVTLAGSFRTDDRGTYRIYGIPAGRYTVSVGAQRRTSALSTVQGQQSYPQTFYPSATDPTQATVVEVGEGDEVSHIDITVGDTVQTYSVTGRVLDGTTGSPVPNVGFVLSIVAANPFGFGGGNRQQQQRAVGAMPVPAISDAAGQFRVDNIPPGQYVLSVAPQAGNGATGQSAPFAVIDKDVSGVEIRTVMSASISGAVALEGLQQDPSILTELLQFQVQVFVQGTAAAASAQTVPINPDGTFLVSGLPAGTVNLSLVASDGDMQGAFKLLRTEVNGVAQPRGIPVKAGDQISGVRLVAAYADGIVAGTVTYQNGAPPAGSLVIARLAPAGQGGRANLGAANVDERGHFLIQDVPAGAYNLIVSLNAQPTRRGQRQTPITAQQQVTVTEGQVTNVTATLDLSKLAAPTPTPTP